MELAFLKGKDPNKKEWTWKWQIFNILGMISSFLGILELAIINIGLIQQDLLVMNILPLKETGIIGLVSGVLGLFMRRGTKSYAWWGIILNAFFLFFSYTILIFALFINTKP